MMNDLPPLNHRDYLFLAVLALYALAVSAGIVWLIIQIVRFIHDSGYGAPVCGAAIVLVMALIVVAARRR